MRIAVAGAGIAGLAAALSLGRLGHEITVFERAEALRPIGAGLQLSPNALDVLDRLEVGSPLRAVGVAAGTVTLRDGGTGRALASVPVASRDGRGYLSLLRSDLQDALLAAAGARDNIALRTGRAVESAARDADGWRVGDTGERFDLVVGADGVHSAIRRLIGGTSARGSGSVALRLRVGHPAAPGIEAWLGGGRHAVAYPVAGGRDTNLVLIVPATRADAAPADLFRSWDPSLLRLVREGEALGRWPLLRHAPLWRAERLALVGDASHAMLPYAAQGAAMAIEDAWVLASCLSRAPDPDAGLTAYERQRAPRLAQVLRRVAFHRFVYHLPRPVSLGRDAVLAVTPPERLRRQLSWLYDWRAPDIP